MFVKAGVPIRGGAQGRKRVVGYEMQGRPRHDDGNKENARSQKLKGFVGYVVRKCSDGKQCEW